MQWPTLPQRCGEEAEPRIAFFTRSSTVAGGLAIVATAFSGVFLRCRHSELAQPSASSFSLPSTSSELLQDTSLQLERPRRLQGAKSSDRGSTADKIANGSVSFQSFVAERDITRRLQDANGNRYEWVTLTSAAGFSPRYAHAAVFLISNKLFIIGGASQKDAGLYLNDVWISRNKGASWSLVTPRSEKFGPRRGHVAVRSANGVAMFVLGGFCGKDCFMNDWWSSENGAVWNKMGNAPWEGRHGHVAVVTSDDTLVVMGGHDGGGYLNDVWSIADPAQALAFSTWKCVAQAAAWPPRYGHTAVTNSRDAILVMGGFFADKHSGRIKCFNDVWRSDDQGATWNVANPNAPWSGRYQHAAQANQDDEIFIFGGLNDDLERCNDVWRSQDDGRSWTAVTPAAPWAARYEHASAVDHNGSLYVFGGVSTGAETFNDVWRSDRTCYDDVKCPGLQTCRDGTSKNFEGLPNPVCVDICDRRIFDKCKVKEACKVEDEKATCIDPCDEKSCKDGYVCEVHGRNEIDSHDQPRQVAEAYCLACGNAKTKFACDKLRQCDWSGKDEACLMKCRVSTVEDKCEGVDYCTWDKKKEKCVDKK